MTPDLVRPPQIHGCHGRCWARLARGEKDGPWIAMICLQFAMHASWIPRCTADCKAALSRGWDCEDGIDEDSEVGCTRLFDGVAPTAEKKSTGSLCKDSKCKDQLRRFGANLIQRAAWQRGLETLGLCKSVGSEYLRSPLLGVCKTPHTTRSIGAGVRFTHNQLAPSLIIWEYLGTFSLNHFNQSTQWSVGKVCFTKHFSAFAAKAGVLLRLPQLSVATASGLSCP